MRMILWLPLAMFVGGFVLVAAAVASGEAEVSLLLIFPVFTGSSSLFLLGITLIILSFFAWFGALAFGPSHLERQGLGTPIRPIEQVPERRTKYGGVVLIGPIPIAFGSDKTVAFAMLAIGIAIAALLLVAFLVL